jgi:hypothetical protein
MVFRQHNPQLFHKYKYELSKRFEQGILVISAGFREIKKEARLSLFAFYSIWKGGFKPGRLPDSLEAGCYPVLPFQWAKSK